MASVNVIGALKALWEFLIFLGTPWSYGLWLEAKAQERERRSRERKER